MSRNLIFAGGVLLASALTAAPAQAEKYVQAQVVLDDLDPADPSVGPVILKRVETAAREVCVAPGYAMRKSVRGCTMDLTADTVRRLAIPQLTAAWKDTAPPSRHLRRDDGKPPHFDKHLRLWRD